MFYWESKWVWSLKKTYFQKNTKNSKSLRYIVALLGIAGFPAILQRDSIQAKSVESIQCLAQSRGE